MAGKLEGKIALITGGSSGMTLGTAETFIDPRGSAVERPPQHPEEMTPP